MLKVFQGYKLCQQQYEETVQSADMMANAVDPPPKQTAQQPARALCFLNDITSTPVLISEGNFFSREIMRRFLRTL